MPGNKSPRPEGGQDSPPTTDVVTARPSTAPSQTPGCHHHDLESKGNHTISFPKNGDPLFSKLNLLESQRSAAELEKFTGRSVKGRENVLPRTRQQGRAARALPGRLTRCPRGDTQEATVTTTTPRPSGSAGRAHTGRGEALRGRGAPENRASRLDSQGLPRCAAASLSQDRQKSTRPALQAETAHGSLPSVQSHGAPGRALHQAEMTEKAVLGAALQP